MNDRRQYDIMAKHEQVESRKSTKTNNKSNTEPVTTKSEALFKNEVNSLNFLVNTKNKQLFVVNNKRTCVVCKNTENTLKCVGTCQSYFHEECMIKSEERYYESKKKDSIASVPQIIHNTNEENVGKINDKNDIRSKSINGLNSVPKKRWKFENPIYDLSKNKNCISITNEDTEKHHELKIKNKELIPVISKEKNFNILRKIKFSTDGKIPVLNLKQSCSLCSISRFHCFVCGLIISNFTELVKCKFLNCGKSYHKSCLKDWPQCLWIQELQNRTSCICPYHVCHLCFSDNPKSSCKIALTGTLTQCISCPTAYHSSEYCIPADSQILSYPDIICSKHFKPPKLQPNTTLCFICTFGGKLICCAVCQSSFHVECLSQSSSKSEEGFICRRCKIGQYPLYGKIVWVKIGHNRCWPAQIVFPNQVPDTVNTISHSVGQFAVQSFKTNYYNWVNHDQIFDFHEGDDVNILKITKNDIKIDVVFQNAVIEAAQAHNAYIIDKDNFRIAQKSFMLCKFEEIQFNVPFGNIKNLKIESGTPCECDPTKPNPCGPDSNCKNRMHKFECQPQLCPAGDKCDNQRFEEKLYPVLIPFWTKDRGFGLKTLEDIKEGSFIIEYVGDVIDEEEFQRRLSEIHQRNEHNYYFLAIDNSRIIDAGQKGNLSRFMNHSCEPNCVLEKWNVNGDTRIGLFAKHFIPNNSELVFDYRCSQRCAHEEKIPCQCGAAKCLEFIGNSSSN